MTLGRRTLFSSSLFIRNQRLSCSLSPSPCPARRLDRVSLASLPIPLPFTTVYRIGIPCPLHPGDYRKNIFRLQLKTSTWFRAEIWHSAVTLARRGRHLQERMTDRPERGTGARTRNRLSLLALSDGCESPTPTRLIMVSSLFANSSLFP